MKNLDFYNRALKQTEEFLNSIEIDKYIKKHRHISDIMDKIEEDYGYFLEDNPIFEGYVFNWMSQEEFVDYLTNKGYHIREIHSYEVW